MDLFGGSSKGIRFEMFGVSHLAVLAILVLSSGCLYIFRNKIRSGNRRSAEIAAAVSLVVMESFYHIWMYVNGIWWVFDSLPASLCSISLILAVALLLTRRKAVYDILLFTALLGATQALVTPYLFFDFPHFRFIHFFYTHMMIVLVPLYFTWVRGFRPTFLSVVRMVLFLNLLLPAVMLINSLTGGNYMFLSRKPETASLLDLLGPHPWYILSLEGLLVGLSLIVWLIFRERRPEGRPAKSAGSKEI